jgi:hypothetical protein
MKIATATLGSTLAFTVALIVTLIAASADGAAQQAPCNKRNDVLGHLAQKYQELPIAIGVTNRGGLVEILSTGDGKTWTIIISSPDGQACMVAAGEGWRALPQVALPQADVPDGPQA